MRFIKEHSYDIIKLYINQLGINIFALIMYTAAAMTNSGEDSGVALPARIGISIFSTLFYFVLIYTAAWDWGAKDKIRIDGGKMQFDGFKGLKLSLFANAVNFILCAIIILLGVINVAWGAGWSGSGFAIFDMILRFTASMYIGISQGVFSWASASFSEIQIHIMQAGAFLVMSLISVFVTHLGYRAGIAEKKIFSFKKKK